VYSSNQSAPCAVLRTFLFLKRGLPVAKPRPRRPSKVDPAREPVRQRLAAGVENSVMALRELRAQGYAAAATPS
jgi:transposase